MRHSGTFCTRCNPEKFPKEALSTIPDTDEELRLTLECGIDLPQRIPEDEGHVVGWIWEHRRDYDVYLDDTMVSGSGSYVVEAKAGERGWIVIHKPEGPCQECGYWAHMTIEYGNVRVEKKPELIST